MFLKAIIGGCVFMICFFIQTKKNINYIAFGDSYTICTGTNNAEEQWPTSLAKHLSKTDLNVTLIANPSKNGYSTQNVIDYELPLLKNTTTDFATLLIGVNDWVRGVDAKTYRKNLVFIIEAIQQKLSNKQQLILITIPDFSATPQGALYGNGRDIAKGIAEFNMIIKEEAKKRNLPCIDIFALTQAMKNKPELIAKDGLHPSAIEYALWEELIYKQALLTLK